MKKPKITEGEWKALITSDGYSELCGAKHMICNNFTMYADLKACEALPKLIDALIAARKEIHELLHEFETSSRPIEKLVKQNETCMQIDEALIDAGCTPDCGKCRRCLKGGTTEAGLPITAVGMIVCPNCGNKRCPKASDCSYECSGSNEPGQDGSVY